MSDTKATELADGLRALAAMIEAHPETVDELRYPLSYLLVSVDTREEVASMARAGLRGGAVVDKHVGDKYAGVNVHFGPVNLHVYAAREEVCEKVVVGIREVTEDVPDPEALAAVPKLTVTKTVEDVEWRCGSLLSAVAA